VGREVTRQELSRSKARARELAAQLDQRLARDRRVGAFVLGRLRRRPRGLVVASAGALAGLLLWRALSGRRR